MVQFALYFFITYIVTEKRLNIKKKKKNSDNNYNQKATDSLLNFETVKYFNAEKHEEERFEKALTEYKKDAVKILHSRVELNAS